MAWTLDVIYSKVRLRPPNSNDAMRINNGKVNMMLSFDGRDLHSESKIDPSRGIVKTEDTNIRDGSQHLLCPKKTSYGLR